MIKPAISRTSQALENDTKIIEDNNINRHAEGTVFIKNPSLISEDSEQ